jgi:NAD(P)-dependent dehydrogenase (short-subunit alcohol dehydrogenase family)
VSRDRVCLVTGATNGIGYETALGLAKWGAMTVIVGRDAGRTQSAASKIRAESGNPRVEHLIADLSSQHDVKTLVGQVRDRYRGLNTLINNAGVIVTGRTLSTDGIETQWAVNHLAYYMIAESLAGLLLANAPARLVNVASHAHYQGTIDFDDLSGERSYSPVRAYNQSKLANVLYTYDLARRLAGSGVTVNCLHPGVIRTGFGLNNNDWLGASIRVRNLFIRGARDGARTSLHLAMSPDVENTSGAYFAESKLKKSSQLSYDQTLQRRLREVSETMTGTPAVQGAIAANG